MRPPKRIDRTPRKASAPSGPQRVFRKGRLFVAPAEVEAVEVVPEDTPVSPLPTAGEAPSKWELRSGLPTRRPDDDGDPVVDLRHGSAPIVDLRSPVRIVDGPYYERRTAGFRSRLPAGAPES